VRRFLAAFALLLGGAVVSAACGSKDAADGGERSGRGPGARGSGSARGEPAGSGRPGGRGGRGGNVAFAVDFIDLESKKVDYVVTAPGSIEAFEQVQVTARVAGVVDKVSFSEGQQVKKGDVLVVIDSARYQLTVNSARAALAKADASLAATEAMVKRREGASEKYPGLIPGEELETYKTQRLTAAADRAVALEGLRVAQLNLQDAWVRAPMEGIIQTRTVETGQYVQAGTVMATLLRNDPMLLRFQVEPREAPRLRPGMIAKFKLRETEREFEAKLTLIAGAASTETRMVDVTGEVVKQEHEYWLRPGSFADVSIAIGARREAVMVPRVAVRATDHGYVTYVIEGEVAKERVVTLGMSTTDGWVEARTGLAAGDDLVVRGAESLTPGARVKPRQIDPAELAAGGSPKGRDRATPAGSGSGAASAGPPPQAPPAGSPGAPPEPTPAASPGSGRGGGRGRPGASAVPR
jgi:multidrug efflux system membrane fusion protein